MLRRLFASPPTNQRIPVSTSKSFSKEGYAGNRRGRSPGPGREPEFLERTEFRKWQIRRGPAGPSRIQIATPPPMQGQDSQAAVGEVAANFTMQLGQGVPGNRGPGVMLRVVGHIP